MQPGTFGTLCAQQDFTARPVVVTVRVSRENQEDALGCQYSCSNQRLEVHKLRVLQVPRRASITLLARCTGVDLQAALRQAWQRARR